MINKRRIIISLDLVEVEEAEEEVVEVVVEMEDKVAVGEEVVLEGEEVVEEMEEEVVAVAVEEAVVVMAIDLQREWISVEPQFLNSEASNKKIIMMSRDLAGGTLMAAVQNLVIEEMMLEVNREIEKRASIEKMIAEELAVHMEVAVILLVENLIAVPEDSKVHY